VWRPGKEGAKVGVVGRRQGTSDFHCFMALKVEDEPAEWDPPGSERTWGTQPSERKKRGGQRGRREELTRRQLVRPPWRAT